MLNLSKILSLLADFKRNRTDEYGIERLGVFGSYARGEATDTSDIDICIKVSHGTLFTLTRIKEELENTFQCPIDLVSLGSLMQPMFKKSLDRDVIFI